MSTTGFTCAVAMELTGPTVRCWGNSAFGQAAPPAGLSANYVGTGLYHACSTSPSGELTCWG